MCLWDPEVLRGEGAQMTLPMPIYAWCFAPDSRSILTYDREGRVARWEGDRFQKLTPVFETFHTNWWRVCFSQDGRRFAAGSSNGFVRIWDVERGAIIQQFRAGTNWTSPSRFLDQGRKLIVDQTSAFYTFIGTPSHADCLWDLASEREVYCWGNPPNATGAAFSHDGRWWVRLGHSGRCCVRDLVSGQETNPPLDILAAGWGPDISPDGKVFAVPSWAGYVRLWETSTWRELKTIRGILLGYQSAFFSPDGTRLITGAGGEEAIKLWDTENYEELLTLQGRGYFFNGSAFSPDGSVLGSVNVSGLLHLWRAPSWAEIEAAERERSP